MGQYWKLINLDKAEAMGHSWGKLPQFLFWSPYSKDLLFNLMVATDPPNLPECDKLIYPVHPGAVFRSLDDDRVLYFPQKAVQRSLLVNLPFDIIEILYSELDHLADVVCLGMTCQVLWELGRHEIYSHFTDRVTSLSWAGDRIICVGDYLLNEDIRGILTPEELGHVDDYDDYIYNFPFHRAFHIERDENMIETMVTSRVGGQLESRGANSEYLLLRSLVDVAYKLPVPETAATVLRNLSRHEYVRGSALTEWRKTTKAIVKEAEDVTFNQLILTRICLSSDSSTSMSYDGDIHQGVWAGNRCDFVGKEWVDGLKEDDDDEWTDVSAEVLEQVELIWRAHYGYPLYDSEYDSE